ncbi:MAG: CAP domain-containing protein [Saprospiraceae bacterium]|nr:CAP domain-containing protein [Saprospiraceae bacterium]
MKRWLSQPATFLLVLFASTVIAQESTIVAQIDDVRPSGQIELVVQKHWSGAILENQKITANVTDDQSQLTALLHDYQEDAWLVTLISKGGEFTIAHAFRQTNHNIVADPLPAPLISLHALTPQAPSKARSVPPGPQEQDLVYLTNLARKNAGLAPLKEVNLLHDAADGHSDRMARADFFAHCDIHTKKNPFTRMRDAGYQWNTAAENIAAGQNDADEVMNGTYGWMNSPGHRANILNASYRELGVGYEYSDDSNRDQYDQNGDCNGDGSGGPFRRYWTQNFGARNGVYPVVINLEAEESDNRTVSLHVYGPSGADDMRFRNENEDWSEWMTYSPNHNWVLSEGSGSKKVTAQVRRGSSTFTASDQIKLNYNCGTMVVNNETLGGTQTLSDCEVIIRNNVMITGQITIQADEVSLENNNEVRTGATLEIKAN